THRDAPAFPTRRSSDLVRAEGGRAQPAAVDSAAGAEGSARRRTTRSSLPAPARRGDGDRAERGSPCPLAASDAWAAPASDAANRSEEHTSELQSRSDLV